VVVGVGVGAGGGVGSGAGADEDLEAAVLGPRHGGRDRSLLPRGGRRRLSQSVECSALLCGARAFLESGAEQDGSGWPLCSFYCAFGCRLCPCLVCLRLRLFASALDGVFYILDASSGPPLSICTVFGWYILD